MFACHFPHTRVSVQGLHPSEEHLKANYITTRNCSSLKAPPEAPSLLLFLDDAPLWSFVASHIPRFFARPKKQTEREKMTTSRGVDRHFRGPGGRNCDVRVKHLVRQPGNAPKARPSHLTTAAEVNKVSEGLAVEGCRPWTETQQLSVVAGPLIIAMFVGVAEGKWLWHHNLTEVLTAHLKTQLPKMDCVHFSMNFTFIFFIIHLKRNLIFYNDGTFKVQQYFHACLVFVLSGSVRVGVFILVLFF